MRHCAVRFYKYKSHQLNDKKGWHWAKNAWDLSLKELQPLSLPAVPPHTHWMALGSACLSSAWNGSNGTAHAVRCGAKNDTLL